MKNHPVVTLELLLVAAGAGWWAWNDPVWQPRMVLAGVVLAALLVLWVAAKVTRRRRRLSSWKTLWALSPTEFEHAVADTLRKCGWKNVKVSGGAGDLQADVTGTTPGRRRDRMFVVVQCKHHVPNGDGDTKKVGSPVVQAVLGGRTIHESDLVAVATSSTFTGPAVDLAEEHGVLLIDGQTLLDAAKTGRLDLGHVRVRS